VSGYTKLFSTIVASTIWREPDHVRIVWITMLAMSNADGVVEASVPGLADLARVTVEQCEDALFRLRTPDPYSRTKDNEGRRIADVDGGFLILNRAKYRDKCSTDDRREYQRAYRAEYRKAGRDKARPANPTGGQHVVNNGQHLSTRSIQTEYRVQSTAAAKDKKSKPQDTCSESWLAELQSDLAYKELSVAIEFARAERWCETNNRRCTRRFFIGWLNRCRPAPPGAARGNGRPDQALLARVSDLRAQLAREYDRTKGEKMLAELKALEAQLSQ